VNVGCHSDAHEQAKWFGDDIALKSGKYDHEFGSLGATTAAMRLLGSGNPPLHRFRARLEFALSGRRELDGMIAQHAAMARTLADQLGLPDDVQTALTGAYEQWDSNGWPGEVEGEAVPLAARLAQLAEFVEVATASAGATRPGRLRAVAPARSSTRHSQSSCPPTAR
jgi:HD domain